MQYKFKTHHAVATIVILTIAMLSFRSRTYESDYSLIMWMLVVVGISSAYASWFFRATLPVVCLLSCIAGSAATWLRPSAVGCLTCFFEIRAEARANGETFYINSHDHVFLVAASLSLASIIVGVLMRILIARNREWIRVNAVSSLVLCVTVTLTGYFGFKFGDDLMLRGSRILFSLICASVGLILSGAWIISNRPIVNPKIASKDT